MGARCGPCGCRGKNRSSERGDPVSQAFRDRATFENLQGTAFQTSFHFFRSKHFAGVPGPRRCREHAAAIDQRHPAPSPRPEWNKRAAVDVGILLSTRANGERPTAYCVWSMDGRRPTSDLSRRQAGRQEMVYPSGLQMNRTVECLSSLLPTSQSAEFCRPAYRIPQPLTVVTAQHVARPRSRKEVGDRTAPRDRPQGCTALGPRLDEGKDPGFPHIPTSSSALPVVIGQQQRRTRRDDKGSKKGNPTQSWFDQSETRRKITCPSLFGKTEMGIPLLMTPSQLLCVGFMATRGGGAPCATMGRSQRNSPAPNDINSRWRQQGS